jgi:hypothetical protein
MPKVLNPKNEKGGQNLGCFLLELIDFVVGVALSFDNIVINSKP